MAIACSVAVSPSAIAALMNDSTSLAVGRLTVIVPSPLQVTLQMNDVQPPDELADPEPEPLPEPLPVKLPLAVTDPEPDGPDGPEGPDPEPDGPDPDGPEPDGVDALGEPDPPDDPEPDPLA